MALNFGLTILLIVRGRPRPRLPRNTYPPPCVSAPNGAVARRRRRRLVMHEWRGESGEEEEFIPMNRVGQLSLDNVDMKVRVTCFAGKIGEEMHVAFYALRVPARGTPAHWTAVKSGEILFRFMTCGGRRRREKRHTS